MKALRRLSAEQAQRLRGLMFSLEGTLLDQGRLNPDAFSMLFELANSGLALIPLTCRPIGWAELLVRQWPIQAVVAENGAVWVVRKRRRLITRDPVSKKERTNRQSALRKLEETLVAQFSDLRPSADNPGRVSSIAFDAEDSTSLPLDRSLAIESFCRRMGAQTTRSSVQLLASFDECDKAMGALACANDLLRMSEDEGRIGLGVIGSNPSDGPCFAAFDITFGVANIVYFLRSIYRYPRFVAALPGPDGFLEVAERLLELRRA